MSKRLLSNPLDASTIYDVPKLMQKEGLDKVTLKKLALPDGQAPSLERWSEFLVRHKNPKRRSNYWPYR